MYKRHFISALIGVQHHLALIGLLTLIISTHNVSAQSQIAQDAYAIFEGSCLICHGPDGAYRETLLMEHDALIEGGTVVPGNPDASELYKRLLGTTENGGAQMPLGQPPLPDPSIDTIRRWILAGAPDWATTPTTDSRFISSGEMLDSIETHLMSLEPFDRAFARYFTLTHLYNAGETAEILREYCKALSKLVNSLSWGLDIVNPQPIDPQQTIYYIDLRHYEWDRNAGWTEVEEAYPYHIKFNAPAQTALRIQLSRLQTTLSTAVPSVNADWFIATAASPPLYNDLLSLPETDLELEDRLEVDVANNILTAPGLRVSRAGFVNSGVSNHNRVVERHNSRYGAYWKSYDFAGSVGTQNIFTHPLAFTHDGGEIIFNLPNGLQGYYLVDGTGRRLDEAPISIVSNPAASDPTVRNGLSCIGCHTEGMKEFTDEVRTVIENDTRPSYNKAHALQLYVEKSEMEALVNSDMVRYQRALQSTGGDTNDVEPVSRFHEAFHSPLNLSHAAAAVGLESNVFLSKIRENAGLQSAGLLVLDGGQIKRDTWRSSFQDVIHALDYPQQVGEPAIVTQPEVIPGRLIDIPDPNLRALLEETLETKTFRPDVMSTLKILRAKDRNISDLTGLEFAVNLEELWLADNPVSDLSPIANCTNLIIIDLWDTPNISDVSPLANLTKLEELRIKHSEIHDISSLVRLTNLIELQLYDVDVSDISAISGMTNLKRVRFRHTHVEDITPVSELFNLEWIDMAHSNVSDLSPLKNLTRLIDVSFGANKISDVSPLEELFNLEELHISGNEISNILPLAGLTRLERLNLASNNILDVSPLAALTNLKWLKIGDNNISDFSPLYQLIGKIDFRAEGNPGSPKPGPIIEGPWLWVYAPGETLDSNWNIEGLSHASGGTVTEIGVSTHGATAGNSVGDEVWTSHKLPTTGKDNIRDMLGRNDELHGIVYGNILLHSPMEQSTIIHHRTFQRVKVWLNGEAIYQRDRMGSSEDHPEFIPATLQQGKNVLLIAVDVQNNGEPSHSFFGFDDGTEYTIINPGVGYTISETTIHVGDTFILDIRAENVFDLAGWQFDITFNPGVLEALEVNEGDFLKTDGGSTYFQGGNIDNRIGRITKINSALLSDRGISGTGTILQVTFKAKSEGEASLALENFLFGSFNGENIAAGPLEFTFTIKEQLLIGDVNRDEVVNILDLILVARQLGKSVSPNSPEDVNGDGVVNIFDLTLVAQGIGGAAAPAVATDSADAATVEAWIAAAQLEDDGSIAFRQGIANLENLLTSLIIPQETALHANYPNPFNPETWIPYQLAAPAEVTLTIYEMNGQLVRRLAVGHQAAGMYQSRSRAAYWDGRNQRGESIASGLYFYTLRAGEFTATRKMLIRK